jgi:hypothetical protein
MSRLTTESVWEIAADFDWGSLSLEAKTTLATIAVPSACGMTYTEIAAQLGVSDVTVGARMRKLRLELLAQARSDER